MGENEKREDIKDLVLRLLKVNEDLKSAVKPLIKGQDYAQRALESHQKLLIELMEKLTGLGKKQETIQKELAELKDYTVDKKFIQELEGRVGRLENVCVSGVMKKIGSGREKEITHGELKEFETFAQKKQDSNLYMMLGLAYEARDQSEKALGFLERATQLDSKNIHARCLKGTALQSLGKHKEALETFEALGEPADCCARVLRFRAYSTAVLGQEKQALELINLAIESDINDGNSWALKGRILSDMQRDMEALGALEKALDIMPDSIVALNSKGVVLARRGSSYRKEALECFDKGISIRKEDIILWHNRGVVLAEMGMHEEAIKSFDTEINLGSKSGCSYCLRGMSKNNLGDHDGALADLKRAFEVGVTEGCGRGHSVKAESLIYLRKDEEALEAINEAIKIDDKDPENWVTKASIFITMKRPEEARKCLEVALELQSTDASVLNNLAYQLYRMGEYSAGLDLVNKALEKEPINVYLLDTCTCLLSGLGRDKESLEVFKRALESRHHDSQITWKELAHVYEKLGNIEGARRTRQQHVKDE